MPNFSSLARLEVPEKFLWVGGGVGFAQSFSCQTQPLSRLGWGFDNLGSIAPFRVGKHFCTVSESQGIKQNDMGYDISRF